MRQRMIILTVAVVLCGMLAGCATQNDKKQAAVEGWEKSGVPARLKTVEDLLERGRLDEAEETLRRCLEADPESARAYFLMGQLHFIENRSDQARLSFTEAVALDASYDAAWYHLGMLFDLDGNTTQAMDAYHTALSLKPAHTDYIVAVAQAYMRTGQIEQARELLEDRLRRQPGNRDMLLTMADLARLTGQPEKTTVYYTRILAGNAKDAEVLEALGYSYVALKDWNRAAETFAKLLTLVKDDAQSESILETAGLCAFNAGQYVQALRHYDRLSVMRRDDAEVWLKMAQAALGADRVERAAANARQALQLNPLWPQANAVLGSAQYLQGQYDAALRSFAYARSDDEVGGFAWFMTGRCYAQLGEAAKAENAYQRASETRGDSPLITRFLKEKADTM